MNESLAKFTHLILQSISFRVQFSASYTRASVTLLLVKCEIARGEGLSSNLRPASWGAKVALTIGLVKQPCTPRLLGTAVAYGACVTWIKPLGVRPSLPFPSWLLCGKSLNLTKPQFFVPVKRKVIVTMCRSRGLCEHDSPGKQQ
jgi:hypothetical protein